MDWCILIPLLVGAICALLGYLLGRLFGGGSNHDDCNDKIARLEAELDACRASKSNVTSSFAAGATATAIAVDGDAAKAVFGKRIKENDLTVVEGIGPKIQELFHNHDVKTWKSLSECSVDKCQSVLNSGGERYKIHNPGTWPEQSKMAYEGRWSDLLKWQDELDGGK
jgi:predicted flap endonuclease-1-like 5' DNA nuclease